jgi:hypothetical protein
LQVDILGTEVVMSVSEETPAQSHEDQRRADRAAAARRIAQQTTWVDLQLRQAMERGDFDELPGYGKPLRNLDAQNDPDWWVKQLIEREQITGVLPPSLQLRKEDAELDGRLDRLPNEEEVRREVEEFNARVRWALYRPPEGPPMITSQRDVDAEVARWAERRRTRRAALPASDHTPAPRRRGRWRWRRRTSSGH